MKTSSLCHALCLALCLALGSLAHAAPAVSAAVENFYLDTLSLEAARGADSLRAEATPRAAASPEVAANDSSAPAVAGTPEGQGSISGKVTSEARGTAVPDARVIVAGRNLSAETDADGRFAFPGLPPGTYSLFLYHSGYAPLTVDSVRVVAGLDASRRFPLPDKAVQGEAVRVTGSATQASDAGMLFARKNSPTVSDGISSEQISKSPDADAAAALKRVTGISIASDGLVYVRGLGERYVNMQLNGLTISSPNPEKRIVPLDMFPTRLLENLSVSKTFTADQPAEFAGGSLQLRTRDYPEKRLIEFSSSMGYDPGATFKDYLTYKGGRLDWLGIEDGTRALPSGVPSEFFDYRSANMGATAAERQRRQQEILGALSNVWTPYEAVAPLNQGYALSLGNKIPLDDGRTLGWLLGGSYGTKWEADQAFTGLISVDNNGENANYRDRFERETYTHGVQWGVLGTTTWQDGEDHKLRLNLLANREWNDDVTRVLGQRETDSDTTLLYELSTAYQTLLNGQVEGEHRLNENGMKLIWMTAVTSASRHEPDRRLSKYLYMRPGTIGYNPEFPFSVAATSGFQDRYWFDLEEGGYGGKLEFETPFEWGIFQEGSKHRGGVFLFSKSRDYTARKLSYVPGDSIFLAAEKFGHPYEDYFDLINGAADSGYITNRNQREKDSYSVDDFQWAAHFQGDLVLSDSWRVIAGLRLAAARVEGVSRSPQGELSPPEADAATCRAGRCEVPFGYDRVALLPAVSVVHAMTDDQNVRAAWTRTFSYPEYREMSPMLFFSYQDGLEIVGNIRLKPTDIYNYDVRWEWFPSASEIVALSGFYKDFRNPVESRIRQLGSNDRSEFANAPSATLWGLEGELRAAFARYHAWLEPFEAVLNYTWIHSEVDGARKRAMQGQSPYLLNAILFYEPFAGKTQMSLLYNRIGRRIAKVGADNFPDVYEEAREGLEYSWSQTVVKGLKLKFTARNLTAAPKVEKQGGLVVRRVENAPVFSLGATYAF